MHDVKVTRTYFFFFSFTLCVCVLVCDVNTMQISLTCLEFVSFLTVDSISKGESRPPSYSPGGFTKANLPSSTLKRLGELEEKVDMLQSKPSVMPHEKEELLNAAVYRVDALEAELIATKKVWTLLYAYY